MAHRAGSSWTRDSGSRVTTDASVGFTTWEPGAMNDAQAERMVRLLEEIRDGQRLQLERQAQALQRQDELLAQQRERLAGLSKRSEQADQLLRKSAKVVAGARILALVALPFVILLVVFLVWAWIAHDTPT